VSATRLPIGPATGPAARAYGLAQAPLVVRNGRAVPVSPGAEPASHVFTAGRLWDLAKNAAALDRLAARLSVPLRAAGPVASAPGETGTARPLRTTRGACASP
jgi:hypothetical protein